MHTDKYNAFLSTYTAMLKALRQWVTFRGGTFDENGFLTGLSQEDEMSFISRNTQLETLKAYAESAESTIKQSEQAEDIKMMYRLLETFKEQAFIRDTEIQSIIDKYEHFTIEFTTTYTAFIHSMKDIRKFYGLAIKRGMITQEDKAHINKYESACYLLEHSERAREYFDQKQKQISEPC